MLFISFGGVLNAIISQNLTTHWCQHPRVFTIPTVQTFNSCTSRPDVCYCLVVQTPIDNMSKNKLSTSMAHIACESKLHWVLRSSIHPCPVNWVATKRTVVYYARATQAFSAGIKCRHCTFTTSRIQSIVYFCTMRYLGNLLSYDSFSTF